MYKNEKEFKKHLIFRLKNQGFHVSPIQTRTIPGVPDLFIANHLGWFWIECKYVGADFTTLNKISFRPGQQSWAYQLYLASKKAVICMVCFKNGVKYFLQKSIYHSGEIPASDFIEIGDFCLKPGSVI